MADGTAHYAQKVSDTQHKDSSLNYNILSRNIIKNKTATTFNINILPMNFTLKKTTTKEYLQFSKIFKFLLRYYEVWPHVMF